MQFRIDAAMKSISTKKGEDGPVSTVQLEMELTPDEASALHELMSRSSFVVTFETTQGVMLRGQEGTAPRVGFDMSETARAR